MSDEEKMAPAPKASRSGGVAGGSRIPAADPPPVEEMLTPRDRRHLERHRARQERRDERRRAKGR